LRRATPPLPSVTAQYAYRRLGAQGHRRIGAQRIGPLARKGIGALARKGIGVCGGAERF